MFKKYIFYTLIIFTNLVFAQSEKWKINSNQSFISYSGNHILHSWEGINNNILGLFVVNSENNISEIAILTKVEDFDSGNSNRDSHALEILESLKYPQIRFYSNNIIVNNDEVEIFGKLTFFGKSVEKKINSQIILDENQIILSGKFDLILSDFQIKLPSFLGVKIDDIVKISFKIDVNKNKI